MSNGPEAVRLGERAQAFDQLARFRAQQAREAARVAMRAGLSSWPHSSDVVADAMARQSAVPCLRLSHGRACWRLRASAQIWLRGRVLMAGPDESHSVPLAR